MLDRQKLTSLERADLDFRTPSIVKGENSSEAIRTHLGERRWAQDKHDNDDWGDYSSLQHAKSSITENEINEFRQRTLNQAEQDWLKTPIGQNSKLGQQIAREKVDNSSVTMSKPSGSTILENSINQVRAVSENINKTEMAINDSDPTQTEEQSNNLVIK